MGLREMVLARVRPFQDESHTIIKNQDTEDIINSIVRCHNQEKREYDKICDLFDEPTAYDTGHKIWAFLRENTRYKEETEDYQTVRSPGAIVATGKRWGLDCKNYSLFTGGILDALNRKGAAIPFSYRFASYDLFNKQPKHVFIVMYPGTWDEIWVDGVLSRYNYHRQPTYFKDVNMLAKVSGLKRTPPPVQRTRARMGQGDGDDDDDIDLGGDEDNVPDPLMTAPSTSDTDFTFSSTAVNAASQAGSDLTDDPSAGQTAMAPNEAGNWDYNSSTDQYELVDSSGNIVDTTPGDNVDSTSSGSWFSNLMNEITGGSGSSSGSTGTSSGTSGSSGSSQQSGQQAAASTVPVTTNNTMLWVVGGIAVLGLIIALTSKSSK